MRKEIIASGKDIQAAIANAKEALGVSPIDDIEYEVIDLGSKGIFGIIGAKPTKVKAYIEIPDANPEKSRKKERSEAKNAQRNDNAPRKNKNGKNRHRRNDTVSDEILEKIKSEHNENAPSKSAAVPEADLSFEKIEAPEGIDLSYDFVNKLIANLGISATAQLYSCSDGTRRITIEGDDASILIGHHGDTLDALQYLSNLASAKKNAEGEKNHSRVTIDIEGYRAKREETLRALARKKAAQALKNNRSVMLEPMTPYERRIIHSEIQAIEGVSTNSIGADNNRKIVIYLTDKAKANTAPKAEEEKETEVDE